MEKKISDCGIRIVDLKTRSQETGEKEQKRISFAYWLLTTGFLPWALSPVPWALNILRTAFNAPLVLRFHTLCALRQTILLMLRGLIHKGADNCLEVGLVGAVIGGINVRDIHSVQDRFQNG